MKNLYYTPPTDEIFSEVKEKAIQIWLSYEIIGDGIREKVVNLKKLENITDNFMYIVALFDSNNQARLAAKLSDEARFAVRQRLIAGGAETNLIFF